MLSMLALLTVSHAQETIPCSGTACDNLNEMVPELNLLWNPDPTATFIDESSAKANRRPTYFLPRLEAIVDAATAGGCTVQGWTGSRYVGNTFEWAVDDLGAGSVETSNDAGQAVGTLDRPYKSFSAQTGSGPVLGVTFLGEITGGARYNKQRKVFAYRNGNGFLAGIWGREKGRNGIAVNLHGICPSGVDPANVFNDWFGSPGLLDFVSGGTETDCNDFIDNDADGDTDCADADCALDPVCLPETDCNDLIDNDADGDTDCADADCALDPVCLPETDCGDFIDNDADGDTDCADADCALDPVCTTPKDILDLSGYVLEQTSASRSYTLPFGTALEAGEYLIVGRNATQADFEAKWGVTLGANVVYINSAGAFPSINGAETFSLVDSSAAVVDGPSVALTSGDNVQRLDDVTWWIDPTPLTAATPGSGGVLSDGLYISEFSDLTGSGNFNYEFVEIHYAGAPVPVEDCSNGVDDDGDTQIDCADTDCAADPVCLPETDCNDGVDNDLDGNTDCADVDCALEPVCLPEIDCADGLDNNLNGLTDCEDPDCFGLNPECITETTCDDGEDNDADGDADCDDLDCAADAACMLPPVSLDVSGYVLQQTSATKSFALPSGTVLGAGDYVIVGRNADKAAFETAWNVTLGANVTYINSVNAFPSINGNESFSLEDPTGALLDGPSISTTSGKNVQRADATNWTIDSNPPTAATPGSGGNLANGLYISEFSDLSGSGNYVYEFVEIHFAG